jgi:hypothetical protein
VLLTTPYEMAPWMEAPWEIAEIQPHIRGPPSVRYAAAREATLHGLISRSTGHANFASLGRLVPLRRQS